MSLAVLKNLSRYDECYTPKDQVLPLLEYLDKDKTYYEATSGISSQIVDGFKKYEYNIVPSENRDFFTCGVDDVYDGVITNPPYSTKDVFIEYCYKLGKPFDCFYLWHLCKGVNVVRCLWSTVCPVWCTIIE